MIISLDHHHHHHHPSQDYPTIYYHRSFNSNFISISISILILYSIFINHPRSHQAIILRSAHHPTILSSHPNLHHQFIPLHQTSLDLPQILILDPSIPPSSSIPHSRANHHPPPIMLISIDQVPDTYLGWASWSLQAFRRKGYGFYWLNEPHVKAQADILSSEFSAYGYDRINLDSGWQDPELDEYGRIVLNRQTFPSGIDHLQSYLARRGLKLGLYYLPGIDARAVRDRAPIMNTDYTADQIIQCPFTRHPMSHQAHHDCHRPFANAFQSGYALNYSHPGSQMYIDSVVDGLYSWNVSFVKLDALVPGSSFHPIDGTACDTRADLAAWRRAIEERYEQEWQHVGRQKIWLLASWAIPTFEGPTMDRNADSWRVEQDIEAYGQQMTTFDRVIRNIKAAALWTSIENNRNWRGLIDLDSLIVSDMTYEESKSMVTVWAILGSPFYLGDDLTTLSESRKALIKNPEVLALQRLAATNPARLEKFNLTRFETNHSRRDSLGDCQRWVQKRRMVVGLSLRQQVDGLKDLEFCLNYRTKPSRSDLELEDDQDGDEWTVQFWVLENEDEVFVSIINAGHQQWYDEPVDVEFSLSELETFKAGRQASQKEEELWYIVRDVWRRKDIGIVSLDGQIKLRLDIHGCVLLRFTRIRPSFSLT